MARAEALTITTVIAALGCSAGPNRTEPAEPETESPTAAALEVTPGTAPPPARPDVRLGTVWRLGAAESDDADLEVRSADLDVVIGRGTGGLGVRGGIAVGAVRGRRRSPTVRLGHASVQGSLDKRVIQTYVRRRFSSFRYCYQRQLRAKPRLSGTVRVRFTIGVNGRVVKATAAGMDTSVANCIQAQIRRIRFPKPTGGGLVQVYYPFVFSPQGGGATSVPTPPAPPEPGPMVKPSEPKPIPEAESPVLKRTETKAPAEEAAPICRVATPPDGLEALVPAARTCYERLLDRDPDFTGRLGLTLAVGDTGEVERAELRGGGDEELLRCIAGAASDLVLTGDAADELRGSRAQLSLFFDKRGGVPPETSRITVTEHDLRLDAKLVAAELPWERNDAAQRIAWNSIVVAVRGRGAIPVIRMADDVDANAVVAAVAAFGKDARAIRFARRLEEPDDWKVINPLGSANPSVLCTGKRASRVTVRIDRQGIWIGTDKGHEVIPLAGDEHDLLGYARSLRALRRHELRDRSDLELAVIGPGVPYEVFAKALEIAIETGFHDAAVLPIGSIRDPRRQPPRAR